MAFLQETHTISLQYDLHLTWNSQVFFKTRFGVDSKVTALLKAACMISAKIYKQTPSFLNIQVGFSLAR